MDTPVIETASLDRLFLDPENPRLGRHNIEAKLKQDAVLEEMRDWSLEELAVSFLESGFWPQEALIAIEGSVPGRKGSGLIVVEGNRRLAALKMIEKARTDKSAPVKWRELVKGYKKPAFDRLDDIPYILQPSRASVRAYLGYRHVTGIKEWNPAEKAEFIAHLIDEEGLTYDQARKRIGSKIPTVRQNYISYRILVQMEDQDEDIDIGKVEDRFSVLYLSLRTKGVQTFLDVDIDADPKAARKPVPDDKLEHLAKFAKWLFGTKDADPLIADSRQVDDFGRILESTTALDYLDRTDKPSLTVAKRVAGVTEADVASSVERAADEMEEALKVAHQHKSSARLRDGVRRAGVNALQLLTLFPALKKELLKDYADPEGK